VITAVGDNEQKKVGRAKKNESNLAVVADRTVCKTGSQPDILRPCKSERT